MWEETIGHLRGLDVAADPALGLSGILESVNKSLKKYVPREWGSDPHLRVSNLTREHLRKVITAFIATGNGDHAAPYYRQGTGTINMLVLALLSQIAEDRRCAAVLSACRRPAILALLAVAAHLHPTFFGRSGNSEWRGELRKSPGIQAFCQ